MLKLYDKTFSTLYGTLSTVTEALVEEERNGLFELSFTMLNTDSLFSYIEKENIVVCNANDTLLNQKFRIYDTRKLMNNRVEVYARHISFDLMYDYIDNVSFENQSCEYALNELFRNSNFSQHYRGYSDIVNAQNYSVSECNVLEAIGGIKGSIIDTFGTGAEILRDNENIHVLSKRGNDNSVTIEYRKNLTGFELEEDTTDLETRCGGYVKYTDSETNEEMVVTAWVDSPLINNYAHPYISPKGPRDYSDKFEDGYIPTIEELKILIEKEFSVNKRDIVKENYKIEFIPLSKCVGYEALNDRISLCDTVTIIDTRYNVNTQAKVIKTIFNVLKNRYESIELGEPKTSLGDIISSSTDDKVTEEQVKDIVSSTPSTNYPNTLPKVPTLESFVYGFANIELRWTFENKVYYAYEVYASKIKDFTPNTFDLIYQGQASSYMFQAQPNETWYFKVCGINSYNKRTQFSNEVEVVTTKIEDLSNYVSEMAIGDALIGELNLGRGWVGQLNANLLDVKGNFSVTDGNGKRTFDIDSFGNVNIQATTLKMIVEGGTDDVATNSQIKQLSDRVEYKFNEYASFPNLMPNGCPSPVNYLDTGWTSKNAVIYQGYDNLGFYVYDGLQGEAIVYSPYINALSESTYSIVFSLMNEYNMSNYDVYVEETSYTGEVTYKGLVWHEKSTGAWKTYYFNHTMATSTVKIRLRFDNNGMQDTNIGTQDLLQIKNVMFMLGKDLKPAQWYANSNEIMSNVTIIDGEGLKIKHENGSFTRVNNKEFYQANEDGLRTTSIRYGGFRCYKWADGYGFLGGIYSTRKNNFQDSYGITYYGTKNAKYLELSFDESLESDTQSSSITPYLSILREPIGSLVDVGVHTQKLLSVNGGMKLNSTADFNNYLVKNASRFKFTNNSELFESTANKLCLGGTDGMSLGYRTGENSTYGVLELPGLSGDIASYKNWNFNNWTMYNMKVTNTLNAQTYQLKTYMQKMSELNEIYSTNVTDNRELRCKSEEKETTVVGELIVELPQLVAENIQPDYQVHISKYGFGDYYIKERNPYYFVIVADKEFSFDWEVVATMLDNNYENIQPYSLITNIEEAQEEKEAIKLDDETIFSSKYANIYD